jgi:broad specificity phosphatase PhoE
MSIYLIRHGQSEFNAAFTLEPRKDPMMFDAHLTELGVQQAKSARKQLLNLKIKHVISSPMIRTIQTAMHIFGNDHPITINPHIREKLAHSCDVGSNPQILKNLFTHLSFEHLSPHWWHGEPDVDERIQVEPEELFLSRSHEFKDWLDQWDDESLAVIGHGTFFVQLAGHHMKNCEIHQYR